MFLTKVVEKIKKKLCLISYFRKSRRLRDSVVKYDAARQIRGENVIRRVRVAYWMTKTTDTHAVCVILTAFPLQ